MERKNVKQLQAIPNVGKAIDKDLIRLGIMAPVDLIDRDPYQLYEDLCRITGKQQDPCVIDVFIAAVRYMEGGLPQKWWEFTQERKECLGKKGGSL